MNHPTNVIPYDVFHEKQLEREMKQMQVVEYEGKKMTWDEFMLFCCSSSLISPDDGDAA